MSPTPRDHRPAPPARAAHARVAGTVGAALLALVVAAGATASAETVLGAALPQNAREVAERRYRSPMDWEGTLKFYRQTYPAAQYPRRNIINQPGVKAVHLANGPGRGAWEGLNIIEANQEVRIYVVPADKPGTQRPPVPGGRTGTSPATGTDGDDDKGDDVKGPAPKAPGPATAPAQPPSKATTPPESGATTPKSASKAGTSAKKPPTKKGARGAKR